MNYNLNVLLLCVKVFVVFISATLKVDASCVNLVKSHHGEIMVHSNTTSEECTWNIQSPENTLIFIKYTFYSCHSSLQIDDETSYRNVSGRVVSQRNEVNITARVRKDCTQTKQDTLLLVQWRAITRPYIILANHSWHSAANACLDDGGQLLSDEEIIKTMERNITESLHSHNITEAWYGKYFVPWAWLKGCFGDVNVTSNNLTAIFKNNQLKMCVSVCSTFNFFALQNTTCLCFDDFYGNRVVPGDICDISCPGNHDERCGSRTKWTIYLNDICYSNSTTWNGTVSRINNEEHCAYWAENNGSLSMNTSVDTRGYSNYCRDPMRNGTVWCFSDTTRRPTYCSVPKCLPRSDDGMIHSCMGLRKQSGVGYEMKQISCSISNQVYVVQDGSLTITAGYYSDWTLARNKYRSTSDRYLADYEHFNDVPPQTTENSHPASMSRNTTTIQEKEPRQPPTDCFKLAINQFNNTILTKRGAKCSGQLSALCVKDVVTCGSVFSEPSGHLSSPDYDSNINCVWTVMGNTGHVVSVVVDYDIETSYECGSDFLQIFFKEGATGRPNISLCGSESSRKLNATSTAITLRYRTDHSVRSAGFNLSWELVPAPDNKAKTPTFDKFDTTIESGGRTSHGSINLLLAIVGSCAGLVVIVITVVVVVCVCRRRSGATAAKTEGSRHQPTTDSLTGSQQPSDRVPHSYSQSNPQKAEDDNPSSLLYDQSNIIDNDYSLSYEGTDISLQKASQKLSNNEEDEYNTLHENQKRVYTNHVDNVYNHLADSSEDTYSHTNTSMKKTAYSDQTSASDVYSHLATSESRSMMQSDKDIAMTTVAVQGNVDDTTDTYDHTINVNKERDAKQIKTTDNVYNHLTQNKTDTVDGDGEVYYNEAAVVRNRDVEMDTYSQI